MQKAGVDTTIFKPHSTRTASTSKACYCNVSLPVIMKAASWSSDCVFNTSTTNQFSPQMYQTVLVMLSSLLLWKHTDCYPYCQAIFCSVKFS